MGELRPPVAEVARHPDGTVVGGLLDAMAAWLEERHGPAPFAGRCVLCGMPKPGAGRGGAELDADRFCQHRATSTGIGRA